MISSQGDTCSDCLSGTDLEVRDTFARVDHAWLLPGDTRNLFHCIFRCVFPLRLRVTNVSGNNDLGELGNLIHIVQAELFL